jgi:hypothetical protein
MSSLIDPTKPTETRAFTADVRDNFAAAKAEIEALQQGAGNGGGGSTGGPLNLWGASSTINVYDAQISATGGATVPGNDGQGDLNYLAGRHVFKGHDGTTQFRVGNVPWSWQWWEAIGASTGTPATLRAGSDLNPDCDGVIALQGHGQLTIGNDEGTFATFLNINQQIINYLQVTPGGYNQGVSIAAAGGDGIACNLLLNANYNGSVVAANSDGPLAVFADPSASSGIPRTSYFRFTAGMSGTPPVITLGGGTNDPIAIQSPGGAAVNLENSNGVLAAFNDPVGTAGTPRTSYFRFTAGAVGAIPTITLGGGTNDAIRLYAPGTGAVSLGNATVGTSLAVVDPGASPVTSYFQFKPGVSGVSPVLGLATNAGTTVDAMHLATLGNGGFIVENINGRLLTLVDNNPIGTPTVASLRVSSPSGAGALILGMTAGTGTDVPLNLQSLGAGEIAFQTAGGTKQARVLHITAATRTVDMIGGGGGASVAVRPSAGSLYLGAAGPLATTATGGFIQIPTCAGPPTGVPTEASLGATMVFDTTGNKLWIYNGSWRSGAFA